MYQDSILRFLGAAENWAQEVIIGAPNTFSLNSFPGNPIDCFLFQRYCNIDEMESEDDEQYYFSTPDYKIRVKLNRFQTRIIFKQLNPKKFTDDRIDLLIKLAWNYSKIAINKKTSDFEPYSDGMQLSLPPCPQTGGPPVRTVYLEE